MSIADEVVQKLDYLTDKKNRKAETRLTFVQTKDGRIWCTGPWMVTIWADEKEMEKEIGVGMAEKVMEGLLGPGQAPEYD